MRTPPLLADFIHPRNCKPICENSLTLPEEHIPVCEIERQYSISNSLVCAWVKKYITEGEDALEPRNGNPYAALHTSKSLSEVERLRLIVAKQEVEIARLKKGYWVEGAGANKEYVTGSEKNTKSSKNSK